MQWFKSNAVGLLGLLLVVGGSLVTLYAKSEVNSGSITQLRTSAAQYSSVQAAQSVTIQMIENRTGRIETQLINFSRSNDRLILALDKLDTLYDSLRISDAIQDERLSQLAKK
jgi:hypothetical protein